MSLFKRAWRRFDEVLNGSVLQECCYAGCAGLATANLLVGNFLTAVLMAWVIVAWWQRDVALHEGVKNAKFVRKVKSIMKAQNAPGAGVDVDQVRGV